MRLMVNKACFAQEDSDLKCAFFYPQFPFGFWVQYCSGKLKKINKKGSW